MKNCNHNASIADYVRHMGNVRAEYRVHQSFRIGLKRSYCEEYWPPKETLREGEKCQYRICWQLRLDQKEDFDYTLDIEDTITKLQPKLENLPIGALIRYTELKRALEEFIHAEGDYPTPNHFPGGSQLK